MRSGAVDHYIYSFKENERLIFEVLRDFIFDFVPDVEESIKWKCPFYSYKGLFCYLNWDNKSKKVALGLVEGFMIADIYCAFAKDTKQIKKILFSSVDDLEEEMLTYYLTEAMTINEKKTKNFL